MSDQVLRSLPSVEPAPADFSVPDAAEWALQVISATFDGSGAGGAYLPALQIIGPGGDVVATFADKNVSVSAGSNCEVTFGPFLRSPSATSGGGSLTWHGGRYTGGTANIAKDATGTFGLTFSTGDALLDLSVPAVPTFLTAGVYIVEAACRCVIALGGSQAAGTIFTGNILISSSTGGMGQNVNQPFTWGSAGSFVPQVTVSSVPINVNAGDSFTVGVTQHDSAAGNHTYDAPSVWVVKLS